MDTDPFQDEIIKLTSKLYCNFRFTKSDVQDIVTIFSDFITNCYNPFLLQIINERILISADTITKTYVRRVFDKYSDPFKNYKTEKLRIAQYSNLCLFEEPKKIELDKKELMDVRGKEMTIKYKNIRGIHIPLKNSLTQLLQIDGLFEATLTYMKDVMNDDTILRNFAQGSLWKDKMKTFNENEIILPLGYFYDEVETGNSQGTHAGENSLGCGYTTCLVFPPNFASKLDSIVLTDIFYAKDKRKYGNRAVFTDLVNDMNNMRREGITVRVKEKNYKVHFMLCVCSGDNKGLNDICGFVTSFSKTHCCRFCYAGYDLWSQMTVEDISFLRTREQYLNDIANVQPNVTGIKAPSILDEIDDYDVITNQSVDIMHDGDEGVANVCMTGIVLQLIEEKCFDIDFLNNVLKTMDFGFEKTNVPLQISLDYAQKNHKLKMSASEMSFFTRYFGLMVGQRVDRDNKYWKLYIKLRELMSILSSPQFTQSVILQLKVIITELLEQYKTCFGNLTSKFHTLLHYIRVILLNGPPIKLSAMRFESKHREVRAIVQATSSRKNVLKTVGDRYMLSLMHYKYVDYKNLTNFECGKEIIAHNSMDVLFPNAKSKICVNSVTVNDFRYKKKVVIVPLIGEMNPTFGEIESVYIVDEQIYFEYKPLEVIGFNNHYYAYSVKKIDASCIISYESIASRTPCLLDEKNGTMFVATRHIL